jgi:hypothetical protein
MMNQFRQFPTKTAEWQALIIESEVLCGYTFDESVENYLVITLDHYTKEAGFVSSTIALDFLKGIQLHDKLSVDLLRTVGDHCLLLAGLFPKRALRKNVSLGYFIGTGKQAYYLVANKSLLNHFDPEVFHKLSNHFVGIMDVLHAMRSISQDSQSHLS